MLAKKRKNEIFLFTPFNTHPDGYKLQVGIYANGCEKGKGTHLSLSTEILKNDNDHKLQWPFQATIKYELLNQLADDKHYQIVTKFCANDDILVGRKKIIYEFIPHSSLGRDPVNNTEYLMDDTLYLRVSVKVDNHHKPWLVDSNKINMNSPKEIYRKFFNFIYSWYIHWIVLIIFLYLVGLIGFKLYK